jgi:hypothetical protein
MLRLYPAFVFMAGHLALFLRLDGQPVSTSGISQGIQAALSNFLALLAELVLTSGAAIAYSQLTWKLFRRKALSALVIDKLISLPSNPWNLVHPKMLFHAKMEWLVALAIFLMPIAAMFPPGALTVEFQNGVLPTVLSDIPTMNISDLGAGTNRDLINRALFEVDGDLMFL